MKTIHSLKGIFKQAVPYMDIPTSEKYEKAKNQELALLQ